MTDEPIEAEELATPSLLHDEKTPRTALALPTVKYRVFDWPSVLTLGPMALAGLAAPVVAAVKRAPASLFAGSVCVMAGFWYPLIRRFLDRREHLQYLTELVKDTAFVSHNGVNVIIGAAAQLETPEMRARIDQRLLDVQSWWVRYAIANGQQATTVVDAFDGALLRFYTTALPDARGGSDWGQTFGGKLMAVDADPKQTVDHALQVAGHECAHVVLRALLGMSNEDRDHKLMIAESYPWY